MKNMDRTAVGHLSAAFTILMWGTTFISTKVLLRSYNPVEILFFRFLIGFAALFIARPKLLKTENRQQELTYAAAGLCGITLYYLIENVALTYTTASNVGVILSISPFFTALLARWLSHGEKQGPRFYLGFVAAIAGIILISYNTSSDMRISPAGDFLALLAAAVWAVYSLLVKKISTFNHPLIQSTRHTFFYGLVFMLPSLFFFDFHVNLSRFAQPVNLFNLLFLSLGASAVGFVTWNKAVSILGAVKTSIYIYLAPVVTIITSAIVLGERFTAIAFVGILLTLTGLLLSEDSIGIRRVSRKNRS